MTNDELLTRIDEDEKFLEQYFGGKFKGQSALREVVELHKQDQWGEECQHCDNGSYPCETIQAIEKELG